MDAAEFWARFWAKVEKSDGGCWLWTGNKNRPNGYGRFRAPWGQQLAHRISWELHHQRAVPNGMRVMHACDVRLCVNPAHLKLGTDKDNSTDMVVKGRSHRGEKSTHAKLTQDDVQQIRSLRAAGVSREEIAERFAISREHVSSLACGNRWAWLDTSSDTSEG